MKTQFLRPEYVEQLPEALTEGVLYISEEFNTTAHKCCCGCGEDVYNKLSPARWKLIRETDGTVSLEPSVGNWKYTCRSHYVIRRNRVIDAGPMSVAAIQAVQQRDRTDRDRYIAQLNTSRTVRERARGLVAQMLRRLRALWPWA